MNDTATPPTVTPSPTPAPAATTVSNSDSVNREQLTENIKTLIADAQGLLKRSASDTKAEAQENLQAGLDKLDEQLKLAQTKFDSYAAETKDKVREKPLESVGVALGAGLILGMLLKS
jgi:ElaB/YqjD/DUF883 family membrane-anchored ribosome-binding protein